MLNLCRKNVLNLPARAASPFAPAESISDIGPWAALETTTQTYHLHTPKFLQVVKKR